MEALNFFTCNSDEKSPFSKSRYVGIQKEEGKIVNLCDALYYALWRVLSSDEEMEEFVEWFYSGNWIYEEAQEDEEF